MEQTQVLITLHNGVQKKLKIPKYGEIKLIIRNGKIMEVQTQSNEKFS